VTQAGQTVHAHSVAEHDLRSPTEDERGEVDAALPPPYRSGAGVRHWVAPKSGAIAGVAALQFHPNLRFAERGSFVIRVREAERRAGIGRSLLRAILREVASVPGMLKLHAAGEVRAGSAADHFLHSQGFTVEHQMQHFELPVPDVLGAIEPFYERLMARGRIPQGGQIVPLSEAPREAVCRLVLDHFGFTSEYTARRLQGTEHGFSQTLSFVAMIGGQVAGAVLGTYQKRFFTVEATAVPHGFRGGWANVALKHAMAKNLAARGVEALRFSAQTNTHRDTVKFALRSGAKLRYATLSYALDLSEAR